jgi:hypothetical protein
MPAELGDRIRFTLQKEAVGEVVGFAGGDIKVQMPDKSIEYVYPSDVISIGGKKKTRKSRSSRKGSKSRRNRK